MRRRQGALVPLEVSLLSAGVALSAAGMPEFYGYAVALELKEHQEARRLTAHGTLYRALDRLQRRGLVQSRLEDPAVAEKEQRPRRRLYHVTAEGEAALRVAEASQDAGHSPLRPRGSDL